MIIMTFIAHYQKHLLKIVLYKHKDSVDLMSRDHGEF